MTLEYTNRKGQRYFVMQERTKTGKVKYYCGKTLNAEGVAELPAEFEIFEHPQTGIVTIRKALQSRILPAEKQFLKEQVGKLSDVESFIIETTEDSLIVHTSEQDRKDIDQILMRLAGPFVTEQQRQDFVSTSSFHPMFRFKLEDEAERLFALERWCFRGRIDGWIPIVWNQQPLDELAAEFLPHLGQESFFELM